MEVQAPYMAIGLLSSVCVICPGRWLERVALPGGGEWEEYTIAACLLIAQDEVRQLRL